MKYVRNGLGHTHTHSPRATLFDPIFKPFLRPLDDDNNVSVAAAAVAATAVAAEFVCAFTFGIQLTKMA